MKNKILILSSFILGISISIYLSSLDPNKIYVPFEMIKDIEKEIEITKTNIENLERYLESENNELKKYEYIIENNSSIDNILKSELNRYKLLASSMDVEGKGIVLNISDSERELREGEDVNDLIVHDIDILKIVNELKISGAEVIAINEERLTANSEIKCSGPTIKINNNTYGQPFIVEAIGDVDFLKSAMDNPNSYISLLKEIYDINIDLEVKDKILIKSY